MTGATSGIGIDEARYQFEVNVFGTARLTQLLLPAMREKGSGTIVNITSMCSFHRAFRDWEGVTPNR